MEPALLVRIAREVPAAKTIKLEDPPTPFKTSRIREVAQGMSSAFSADSAVSSFSKN